MAESEYGERGAEHGAQPAGGVKRERGEEEQESNGKMAKKQRPRPWASRSVANFKQIDQIGSGTYGHVMVANDLHTGELVALKKIKLEEPPGKEFGFPVTAIREIKILSRLRHANIIQLKEIVTSESNANSPGTDTQQKQHSQRHDATASDNPGSGLKSSIFMVFEHMDHDLQGLHYFGSLQMSEIKCYMRQLLYALAYLHDNGVLHRDLKLSNILINKEGIVKLADFGLARDHCKQRTPNLESTNLLTNNVVTLWYRAPELLLGSQDYGPQVDLWSAGCILAELVLGKTLIQGEVEANQLELIFQTCGSPTEDSWPEVTRLKWWPSYKPEKPQPSRLREKFAGVNVTDSTLLIIEQMLQLNPNKRISAKDALLQKFFWDNPLPLQPKDVPKRNQRMNELTANTRKHERRKERV